MTVGRYHELTRMDGYKFIIANDDTLRVLAGPCSMETLTEKWLPIYGRYTLEYTSLREKDTLEYHIRAGMTVSDHISTVLCNPSTIGVTVFDIRDMTGYTLEKVTAETNFKSDKYGLYPVKSKRRCFDKVILKVCDPPYVGHTV